MWFWGVTGTLGELCYKKKRAENGSETGEALTPQILTYFSQKTV